MKDLERIECELKKKADDVKELRKKMFFKKYKMTYVESLIVGNGDMLLFIMIIISSFISSVGLTYYFVDIVGNYSINSIGMFDFLLMHMVSVLMFFMIFILVFCIGVLLNNYKVELGLEIKKRK